MQSTQFPIKFIILIKFRYRFILIVLAFLLWIVIVIETSMLTETAYRAR